MAAFSGTRLSASQLFLVNSFPRPDISGLAAELRFPLLCAGLLDHSRISGGLSPRGRQRSPWARSLCAIVWSRVLACAVANGTDGASDSLRAAVSTHTTKHPTTSGNASPAKVTPVGFEPTPLRNGALSHCLRPLGQSVLGTTFWQQNSCYTAVLGDLRHNSRYLWARRRTPISTPARRAPDHSHNSGGPSPRRKQRSS